MTVCSCPPPPSGTEAALWSVSTPTHLDGGKLLSAILFIIRAANGNLSFQSPDMLRWLAACFPADWQLISIASRPDGRKIFLGGSMLVFLQYCSNFHRSHGDAPASIDGPHLSRRDSARARRCPATRNQPSGAALGAGLHPGILSSDPLFNVL